MINLLAEMRPIRGALKKFVDGLTQ